MITPELDCAAVTHLRMQVGVNINRSARTGLAFYQGALGRERPTHYYRSTIDIGECVRVASEEDENA
jgi:hypothetical protein